MGGRFDCRDDESRVIPELALPPSNAQTQQAISNSPNHPAPPHLFIIAIIGQLQRQRQAHPPGRRAVTPVTRLVTRRIPVTPEGGWGWGRRPPVALEPLTGGHRCFRGAAVAEATRRPRVEARQVAELGKAAAATGVEAAAVEAAVAAVGGGETRGCKGGCGVVVAIVAGCLGVAAAAAAAAVLLALLFLGE